MTELEMIIEQSPKLSRHTKRAYSATVRDFLQEVGHHPAAWTGHAAQSFYNGLLTRMPPQSANVKFSGLRYVSKRRAQLEQNPMLDFASVVETAKAPKLDVDRRALTPEEGTRLIDACRGPRPIDLRDFGMTVLGFTTGMRRFSMAGITLADFGRDRTRGYPFVEITLKGGSRHKVPLTRAAVEAMTPWKRWLSTGGIKDGALFRSVSRERLDGKVAVGEQITVDGIYHVVKARARKAQIEDFSPHIFRHTFVTWAKQRGAADHEIAAITGHVVEDGRSQTINKTYTDHTMAGTSAADAIGEMLW
jgi:integrase